MLEHRAAASLLVVSMATTIAVDRLLVSGASVRVFGPVLVAVVVAQLTTGAVIARSAGGWRTLGVGIVAGLLTSGIVTVLAVDPGLIDPASPAFVHLGSVPRLLRTGFSVIGGDGTPLPAGAGVVMIFAMIAAATATLSRALWSRHAPRSGFSVGTVVVLAPSFALFGYSSLISAQGARTASVTAYLAAALVFVVAGDAATAPVGGGDGATGPSGGRRSFGGVVVGLAALGVVVGTGLALSGMRLSVLQVTPESPPGGTSASSSLIPGTALVTALLDTEVHHAQAPILSAKSPFPTYWAVATLSSFNGTAWVASRGVEQALGGMTPTQAAPRPLPSPSTGGTFTTDIDIDTFASRLLPAPSGARTVTGLAGAQVLPEEGVLATETSGPGTSYSVTALTPSVPASSGSSAGVASAALTPYLALPSQPAIVAQLATQAAGGASTPLAKAQALVDWFRSGRFRYTLDPPPTPGPDPLVTFLTVTKAGYCQQFAGAYALLARQLGLPTRLVVGFATGVLGRDGRYHVSGADAHEWPQVYLGPSAGWVSVEPTPRATTTEPTPTGVLEPTATVTPTENTTPAAGTAPHTPGASATTPEVTQPPPTTLPHPARRPAEVRPTGTAGILIGVLVALAVLALVAGLVVGRIRRSARRRGRQLSPADHILASWQRAQRTARRRGLERRPAETLAEYAARLSSLAHLDPPVPGCAELVALAQLVEAAAYGGGPTPPGGAAAARQLAEEVERLGRRRRRVKPENRAGTTRGVSPIEPAKQDR